MSNFVAIRAVLPGKLQAQEEITSTVEGLVAASLAPDWIGVRR
jgi:hypothetical protein